MNVCLFEHYRRLNGGTDFLEIFTLSSYISGSGYLLLFMLKFQMVENHAHIYYITYYCKLITKWVYWINYNSKIPQILYK